MPERIDEMGGAGQGGISELVSGILSDPEMMSVIGRIAKELKGEERDAKADAAEEKGDGGKLSEDEPALPEVLPRADGADAAALFSRLAPLLSGAEGTMPKKSDDRACLLRALKPYLSQGRSEAIDYIIKFSSIANMLKRLS